MDNQQKQLRDWMMHLEKRVGLDDDDTVLNNPLGHKIEIQQIAEVKRRVPSSKRSCGG